MLTLCGLYGLLFLLDFLVAGGGCSLVVGRLCASRGGIPSQVTTPISRRVIVDESVENQDLFIFGGESA